jgi:GTPase
LFDLDSLPHSKKTKTQPTSSTLRQRVVLVHLSFSQKENSQEALEEFKELARSSGAEIVSTITGFYKSPHAKYFAGIGKVEEVQEQIQFYEAELVLFNHILTPSQERNLERFLNCQVLDRTRLILDIFAKRARTFEGCLQVELAQLQYLSTRLVRGWTHLERQRGGIGLRGPGETQLETDKRLIRQRIKTIKQQLQKVRSQREQGRRSRNRSNIPMISMVGYTNAGKSTLFNRLSRSHVYAADQLFATLDPTLRRIELPKIGPVILADTVGFIRQLPHTLVEAFQATLEEVRQADLLLHVVDGGSFYKQEMFEAVNAVLKEIHADQIPQLWIYNKLDLIPHQKPGIRRNKWGEVEAVWLSSLKNQGMDLLEEALIDCLSKDLVSLDLKLTPEQGRLRALLYQKKAVIRESVDREGNALLHIQMRKPDFNQLKKQYPDILC